MNDERGRSSLTPYAHLMREPDPSGARRLAARKWHDDGTVILLPDSIERLSWQDREFIKALAARIYGKRDD